MTIRADILLRASAVASAATNAVGSATFSPVIEKTINLLNGTTANKADLLYSAERSVAASTNDDIDLAGVLSDAFGTTITAAELVGIIIVADATNVSTLSVGAGTNPFAGMWGATGDIIKVFPGGFFANVAPDASGLGAVSGGATDILRVANGAGGTAKYQIMILARTA